jgi:hypothetical protein
MSRVLFVLVSFALTAAPARSQEDLRHQAAHGLTGASLTAQDLTINRLSIMTAPEIPSVAPTTPTKKEKQREPLLQKPSIENMHPAASPGRLLGAFRLAERLDSHRALFRLELGAKEWELSMASDSAFKVQYLTLRHGGATHLRRIESLSDLRGKGVNVRIDDKTVYNFKVSVNIFSPARGSTLKINPISGTSGRSHKIKTGKVLDAVERESFVFRASGKDIWLLYGTSVDSQTNEFTDSRSLLFVHENGLSSKAWPVAEARLVVGQPLTVGLGKTKIVLLKTLAGDLRIHAPGGASLAAQP